MTDAPRAVILVRRPDGVPGPDCFDIRPVARAPLRDGEIRIRHRWLSVDPAMRGWVSAAANYSEPVPLGGVMRAIAVGDVIESRTSAHAVGDVLCGLFGWAEEAVVDASAVWWRHAREDGPEELSLGVLGLNGITAYFGLSEVGAPREGETVVVSTAAGAVGSAAGQIAAAAGARTVGITSTPEKMALCRDLFGFDAVVSYRSPSFADDFGAACPNGVDVYFDNTGGAISDAVSERLATGARWIVCGTAATTQWTPPPQGPRIERRILVARARMQGILAFDWKDRFPEARQRLAAWVRDGRLAHREDVLDGLDAAPGSIERLYAGSNSGKLVIRLPAAMAL